MKAITILTFASLSVTGALGQNITSVLTPSGKKHTHIFGWERGPVSIDARIFSHGDLSDFFMLDYKGVNIFLWDMDQIQEFYSVLKSYAEETPVPSGIRVNGTWSTSMLTGGLYISDGLSNGLKVQRQNVLAYGSI